MQQQTGELRSGSHEAAVKSDSNIDIVGKRLGADGAWISTEPLEEIKGLPDYGFRIKFDHTFPHVCKPFRKPRLRQIIGYAGFSVRYTKAWYDHRRKKRKLFIDNFNMVPWRPIYGAPIGGIGCGTIGRGFRGEFCRFQLIPGLYQYEVVDANQFILTLAQNGQTIYQKVLNPQKSSRNYLQSWQWGFPPKDGTYQALYPFSWTVYEIPEHKLRLFCKQISPFIPGNYKDSSLPSALFEWKIENCGDCSIQVSLTFTFKNGQGGPDDKNGGVWSEGFEKSTSGESLKSSVNYRGVFIHQKISHMDCTYAVSALESEDCYVTRLLSFNPCGDGSELWSLLFKNGELSSSMNLGTSQITREGQELAVAVCSTTSVEPGKSGRALFSLVWYMPVIKFGSLENLYKRRYSRYFSSAETIVDYSFLSHSDWVEKIEFWQNEILGCKRLPSWYKSALFNELYYISDGGTLWLEAFPLGNSEKIPDMVKEYGRFAYLEGHEYRMYNTYDVHHYASFALLMLWPKLQLSLQYDIASFVREEQARQVTFCMDGSVGSVKVKDCVPHDIGDPYDEPWVRLNAYTIHPTHEWKDLNVKFVLQVYRDFIYTGDQLYLKDMYPIVKVLMEKCLKWDVDGDGIIDNAGFADQTFDAWNMTGASAYCGGMWLAAVKMFCLMAQQLNQLDDLKMFSSILQNGIVSFERKLWNGKYYNFDSSSSGHHNSCMADQLAGHWFLKASKVKEYQVFSKENVMSALNSIFQLNVLPYRGGEIGAINGARPDGKPDITSMQAEEFWTGVTYAVGASMIQEGMINEGWQTAFGAYHTCYERFGLAFQTPEAYFIDGRYRSLGYMRPLAIWSIQLALELYQPQLLERN